MKPLQIGAGSLAPANTIAVGRPHTSPLTLLSFDALIVAKRGRFTMSNRISKYFDNDGDQDLYEEICQHGWDGMVNHTLQIWFGAYPDIPGQNAQDPVEDFGFTTLNHRRN